MSNTHWSDSASDLDWTNYSLGWDAGRKAGMTRDRSLFLAEHGEAFCDGFADGWDEAGQS